MSRGSLVELVDREEALRMDAALVRVARSETVVRLAIGEAFVALGTGYRELGFSSLEAYARERVVRSPGWVRVTRRVADRLCRLPRIRERLVKGPMRWSMAELLARHATAEDEEELLEASAGMTVRQVRAALRDRGEEAEPAERMGTLELSMTFEEACALTATRPMAELVNGSKAPGEWMASMLGEAQDSLTLVAPHADPMPEDVVERHERWLASIEEGERRMDAREARAERSLPPMPEVSVSPVDELPVGSVAIDRVLFRELAPRLASSDVRFGELLASFFAVRGWKVLGFATEKQYAEERLGMSRAAVHERIALWRRARHLEKVGDALRESTIGYEAAVLISRVATPDTQVAWVERAKKRTHKHLAEEVRAVEMIMEMMRLEKRPGPPDDEEVAIVRAIRRDFASGAYARRAFAIERDDDGAPRVDPRSSSPYAEMARAARAVQEQLRTVITAGRESAGTLSCEQAVSACTGLVEPPAGPLPMRDLEDDIVWVEGAPSPSRELSGGDAIVQLSATSDARTSADAIVQMSATPEESARGDAIVQMSAIPLSATASAFGLVASASCEPGDADAVGERVRDALRPDALRPRWPRTVRLRIRAPEWVILHYRQLEAAYQRSGYGGSFIQFLVLGFWTVWAPVLGRSNACEPIMRRDLYECTCPVCGLPAGPGHHVQFRAHGGSDDRRNLTSPCPWCHLEGVHGGRLRVKGEAPGDLVWTIGRTPIMEVHGRERRLAA